MNRREVLQRAALVLGYAITGPALTGVLEGCKASPDLTFKPEFLNQDQASLISALSEIILPRTDTPGAIDAGVPGFIDKLLKDVYSKESQETFLKNLAAFDNGAKDAYGKSFADCDSAEQIEYFKKHHDAALGKTTGGASSGFWNSAVKDSKPFVMEVKELTLLGFFTSEPGATQVLQYKQVPGPYKGCVPLSTVGKTWAT
jgi:hypothetical protein